MTFAQRSAWAVALLSASFLSIPAIADENGVVEREKVPSAAAKAPAGPIQFGGPWNEFNFTGVGVPATGCFPADPSAPGCGPSSAGNSHFVGAPPWTFTAPSDGATLTVTDAFLRGDAFEVLDNGNPIGTTPAVPTVATSCGSDPVPCLGDPSVSHAVFDLGPGAHSITIIASSSPYGSGAAYFRVDQKREHLVCYRIAEKERERPREVITEDQFGTSHLRVLDPEFLCVPASKTEVGPSK